MTVEKAIEIIEKYSNCIIDLRPEAIVQPNSALKYSSGMIKYAHFFYIGNVIEAGNLTNELASWLIESYASIDSIFVDPDDAEPINLQYREYVAGLKKGIITEFKLSKYSGELNASIEFQEFIREYLWRLNKEDITVNIEKVMATHFLEEKFREEENIDGLLKLAIESRVTLPLRKK